MVKRPINLRSYEYDALRDQLSPLARNRAVALRVGKAGPPLPIGFYNCVSRRGNCGQITHVSRGAAEHWQIYE
jgi:hypothetical protein